MVANMLTAQQVQNLLDVDASTVYRMAGDGRLPAVRIGRQWRFPAEAIESLLIPPATSSDAMTSTSAAAQASDVSPRTTPDLRSAARVPITLATTVLEAVAPALGVTMVVTDLQGRTITPVVNPAPAIAARLEEADFLDACTSEWRVFAEEVHLAPRLRPGGFGFLCAHSLVRHGVSLVAMVLAGGIAPEGSTDPDLFHLDDHRRSVVLETLPRTAALLSQLVTATPTSPTPPGPANPAPATATASASAT